MTGEVGGADRISGGAGNDIIWAATAADVTGQNDVNGDTIHGYEGNDTIRVGDGEKDTVYCGRGTDTVYADYSDVFPDGDCENVSRSAPR